METTSELLERKQEEQVIMELQEVLKDILELTQEIVYVENRIIERTSDELKEQRQNEIEEQIQPYWSRITNILKWDGPTEELKRNLKMIRRVHGQLTQVKKTLLGEL